MFSKRARQREARVPELLDVAHEAEGAGPREARAGRSLASKSSARPDGRQRMVEVDVDFQPEAAIVGPQLAVGAAQVTRTGLRTRDDSDARLATASRCRPGRWRRRKASALPSRIGTSGPSISTSALSTPRPVKGGHQVLDGGDRGPAGVAEDGANSVATTELEAAAISRSPSPSSQCAGRRCRYRLRQDGGEHETGSPEWTPTPDRSARSRSVVCLPAFIFYSASSDSDARCALPFRPRLTL